MKKLILLTLVSVFLTVGCSGSGILLPFMNDADGVYNGWVNIKRSGMGFDRSFNATLRIWDDGYRATLTEAYGQQYVADYVDYDPWSDQLEIYFRVIEERWSYDCGQEIYDWEMRLVGRLSGDYFRGDLQADIDPEDYYSDYCHMNFNPPPEHLGTFELRQQNDYWY